MLSKEEFNNKISEFLSINNGGIKEKRKVLEAFTQEEHLIREYHLVLSEFEKIQNDVFLQNFQKLYTNIINDLLDFNPYDVKSNIQKVYQHIEYITKYKDNLLFVSSQINQIIKKWEATLLKNQQFINSSLNKNFNDYIKEIEDTMASSGINNVAEITFKLEDLNERVDKNIGLIGTLNKYKDFYMFQGEKAKKIEQDIINLVNIPDGMTEGTFHEEAKVLIKIIEDNIENSKTKTLGIPVIVAKNFKDKHIKRFTLKFKDFILKEDPFFNSKGVEFLNLKEYFYLDGVPQEGIFEGKKIIEELGVDEKYSKAVNEYVDAATKNFYISIGIFLFLGLSSIVIANIIVSIVFTLLTIGGYFLFSAHLDALKKNIEEKYKRKSIFLYKSIDMVIYDRGDDVSPTELIDWIIFKLNDTLYNEENIKGEDLIWLEN